MSYINHGNPASCGASPVSSDDAPMPAVQGKDVGGKGPAKNLPGMIRLPSDKHVWENALKTSNQKTEKSPNHIVWQIWSRVFICSMMWPRNWTGNDLSCLTNSNFLVRTQIHVCSFPYFSITSTCSKTLTFWCLGGINSHLRTWCAKNTHMLRYSPLAKLFLLCFPPVGTMASGWSRMGCTLEMASTGSCELTCMKQNHWMKIHELG